MFTLVFRRGRGWDRLPLRLANVGLGWVTLHRARLNEAKLRGGRLD
jgi:hypothetical protein